MSRIAPTVPFGGAGAEPLRYLPLFSIEPGGMGALPGTTDLGAVCTRLGARFGCCFLAEEDMCRVCAGRLVDAADKRGASNASRRRTAYGKAE